MKLPSVYNLFSGQVHQYQLYASTLYQLHIQLQSHSLVNNNYPISRYIFDKQIMFVSSSTHSLFYGSSIGKLHHFCHTKSKPYELLKIEIHHGKTSIINYMSTRYIFN